MYYDRNSRFSPDDYGPEWLLVLLTNFFIVALGFVGVSADVFLDKELVGRSDKFVVTASPHGVLGLAGILLGMPKMRLDPQLKQSRLQVAGSH